MAIKATVKGKTCRVKSCGVRLTKCNKSSSGNICKPCWAKERRGFVKTHRNNTDYKKSKREAYERWLAKVMKFVGGDRQHISKRGALRLYKELHGTPASEPWYSDMEMMTE